MDVVVNFTGGDTWVKSLRTLHRNGRVLTCGATAGYDPKGRPALHLELRAADPGLERLDPRRTDRPARAGARRQLQPIIDRTYGLADINDAFRQLEDRQVFGKILVKP